MLILTEYIAKHELKPLQKYFKLKDILSGSEKVLKNLAIETKPPQKIPGYKFFKVRIGQNVKGRMIVFMVVENKKIVPLLIRLKKDKLFGMNIAMKNQDVVNQININLDKALQDIQSGNYQEFKLKGF